MRAVVAAGVVLAVALIQVQALVPLVQQAALTLNQVVKNRRENSNNKKLKNE